MPISNVLLPSTVITTAVTAATTTPIDVLPGTKSVSLQSIFTYGSGGTTAKVWLQTSFDGGNTWCDIINNAFTTSTATKVGTVLASSTVTPVAPTDAALADNTTTTGLLGSKIRLKYTTTGTYAASTSLEVRSQFNQ